MQKLQLSIPEPCHENWQQMTPTDQGRFCNACAKEVIDFSTMTDIQVLNYFTSITNEKVCGRALPEQLDRTLSRPDQPRKKLFWYWNYIVMFLMFFGKGNTVKAQGGIKRTTAGGVQAIPAVDLNKIRQTDVNNALAGKVGEVAVNQNRIITGKVTDNIGNPVPFASLKIKGTNTGVSADANGAYSIRVNANAVLIISGAGFIETEIPVGTQSALNTVLDIAFAGEVVVLGGITSAGYDDVYSASDKTKSIAIIKVRDVETDNALHNAKVIVTKNRKSETAITDQKGTYRIKGIKEYDNYFIKVTAEGYDPNEFTIEGSDFKNRKNEWEVLLQKQKIQPFELATAGKPGVQNIVRLGGMHVENLNKEVLYVVDGTAVPKDPGINPNDIEDITILQGAAATALFGTDGANGAIVITTKKSKVKNLDTVTVSASGSRLVGRLITTTTSTTTVMGATVKRFSVKTSVADSLRLLATKINGTIKIYPNPVQRGQQYSIALKLKEAGLYQMQITDAGGRIVLQKQINANSKEFTEKILADSRWSSGAYYISITDSKNKLISKTSFIFK